MHHDTLPTPTLLSLYKRTMMVDLQRFSTESSPSSVACRFVVFVDLQLQENTSTIDSALLQWFEKVFSYFNIAMQDVQIVPLPTSMHIEKIILEQATQGILLFTDASSVRLGGYNLLLKKEFDFIVGKQRCLAKLPLAQHCAFTKDSSIKKQLKHIIEKAVQYGKRI